MREKFIEKAFYNRSIEIIHKANAVIAEYQAMGFTLTLRQLYYQFVARGWIPNKQTSYDNLGVIISDARLAGYIDWDAIEDRTRFLRGHKTYFNPADAIEQLAKLYRIDMWKEQERRVECWIEKDALVGVIEQVCAKYDVDYFACRGYASQSELYAAGKRIEFRREEYWQDTLVLHLGDHDPSGMDMTRDNEDRLSMFAGRKVEVRRIALNMNQVRQYDPPPNPTKLSDSRAEQYIENYGEDSWELDALSPEVIARLIEDNIKDEIDLKLWNKRENTFKLDRKKFTDIISKLEQGEL